MGTQHHGQLEFRAADATPAEHALLDATEAFVSDALAVTGAPGFCLSVGLGGRLLWERSLGAADLARESPMAIDTTWPVGSFAKLYLAVAALQPLVEHGTLELFAPARSYVPSLELLNPLGEREIHTV